MSGLVVKKPETAMWDAASLGEIVVWPDSGAQSLSWNEIMSGNDVKMPRDPGVERTLWSLKNGNIPQTKVRASAKRVLELLLAIKGGGAI